MSVNQRKGALVIWYSMRLSSEMREEPEECENEVFANSVTDCHKSISSWIPLTENISSCATEFLYLQAQCRLENHCENEFRVLYKTQRTALLFSYPVNLVQLARSLQVISLNVEENILLTTQDLGSGMGETLVRTSKDSLR